MVGLGKPIRGDVVKVHDFNECLAASHAAEDLPFWEIVYRRAFPGFESMMSVREDGPAQRGGIDRVIKLRSGKTVTVDEKVRYKFYDDIAIERWSNRERRIAGWGQKSLLCDFIAYAFLPVSRCYLLPALALRAAWLRCGREWIAAAESEHPGFRVCLAPNRTYVTESIAVPIPVLLEAIHAAQIIDWAEP